MAIKSKKVRMSAREKSKLRIRKRVLSGGGRPRLSVFRSGKHMYAQIVSDLSGKTLVAASTLDEEVVAAIPQAVEAAVAFAKKSGEQESKKEGAPSPAVTLATSRSSKSVAAALAVGAVLAKRALANNVAEVVFDRNGFVYHGRVRAVAEGARAAGLNF